MSAKYISNFPKPVLNDLATGKWLPVVGAGMSLNATVPPGKNMPLWAGLSKELADELADFTSTSTLDAISAYEHEFGRARLIERLSEILLPMSHKSALLAAAGRQLAPDEIVEGPNNRLLM